MTPRTVAADHTAPARGGASDTCVGDSRASLRPSQNGGVPTRRQVLIGAGTLAVVGVGAGLEESGDPRVRRLLNRLGLVHSPDHRVPAAHVKETSGELTSVHMPAPVGWTIATPSAPVEGVIYCLHGQGSDHRMAFDDVHVPDVAAAANAPLAVAAVDGGKDSYWHRRADGTDPLAMLLDEFIPLVEQHLGSEPPRALLGWSMGGYGALLAAERAPARFAVVAAASPTLWTDPDATPSIAFDGAADYHRNDVFTRTDQLAAMTVRIDCGTDDPFHDADAELAAPASRMPITAGSAPASTTPPIGAASPPTSSPPSRARSAHRTHRAEQHPSTSARRAENPLRSRSTRRRVVLRPRTVGRAGGIAQATRTGDDPGPKRLPTAAPTPTAQPIARTHRLTRSCRAREPPSCASLAVLEGQWVSAHRA